MAKDEKKRCRQCSELWRAQQEELGRIIAAREAAARRDVLEELKSAMVDEMARINRGRGFKDTNEVHGVLPEQLRLLCAKYAAQAGGGR